MSDINISSEGTLTVSGSLNTNSVMGLWPNYKNELTNLKALKVDLGTIEHFDTAGLAWLIQLKGECDHQKIPFSLINTPEKIISLANLSQVKELLSL